MAVVSATVRARPRRSRRSRDGAAAASAWARCRARCWRAPGPPRRCPARTPDGRARNCATIASFSSGSTLHVAYTRRPPGFTSVAAAARIDACLAASSATADSGCRHLRSGLRRSVPKPVHGASTSTRSILPARRLTLVSRSLASTCGWTFDKPGALQSRRQIGEALLRDVERVEAPLRAHQRAQQQRLAAGARAEIHHHVRALRRHDVADQLAALVLHFEPAVGEPGMLRERGAPGDADAQRRIGRGGGVEAVACQRCKRGVARRLQRIHAQVERRRRRPTHAPARCAPHRRRPRPAGPRASRAGRARPPAATRRAAAT